MLKRRVQLSKVINSISDLNFLSIVDQERMRTTF